LKEIKSDHCQTYLSKFGLIGLILSELYIKLPASLPQNDKNGNITNSI
jgi:hypothetical protein